VDDLDGQTFAVQGHLETAAQRVLGADEVDADGKLTAGEDRSPEFRLRRLVGAHGIESDVNQHRWPGLAGFLYFENVATLICSALGAGTVRELAFVAAGALGEADEGERVMGAALGGAGLGVTPLWIRHG
jgi:hypothetical protein